MIVAPITEASENGVSRKTVWFPEGGWWSVATDELIQGPATKEMEFSKTDIPYFYREGSIVPLNPSDIKNVTEHPEHLILNIIAGKDGKGHLYEDAGDNSDYATRYATTEFSQSHDGKVSTYMIHPRKGIADNLPAARTYTLKIYNTNKPNSVKVNGSSITNFSYSPDGKCTTVEVPLTPCSSTTTVEVE